MQVLASIGNRKLLKHSIPAAEGGHGGRVVPRLLRHSVPAAEGAHGGHRIAKKLGKKAKKAGRKAKKAAKKACSHLQATPAA